MWISFLLFLLLLLGAVNSILPASSPEKSIFSQSRKRSTLPDLNLNVKTAINVKEYGAISNPSLTSSPEKSIHGKNKKRRMTAILNLDPNNYESASVLPLSQGITTFFLW